MTWLVNSHRFASMAEAEEYADWLADHGVPVVVEIEHEKPEENELKPQPKTNSLPVHGGG